MAEESSALLHCSFCGKDQNQVRKLVAGPTVYICDECIDLCNEIIGEEASDEVGPREFDSLAGRSWPGKYLMPPQIVTRFSNLDLKRYMDESPTAVLWICEGCGWNLRLKPDAWPPSEHSIEFTLAQWPDRPRDLTLYEATFIPRCDDARWRRLL